jgi:hypothetical protein
MRLSFFVRQDRVYTKTTFLLLTILLTAFCSQGQSQRPIIILTSHDVDTNSVRLITQATTLVQNVVFRYAGKTSAEIKSIRDSHPRAKIMREGVVVAETVDGGCAGYCDKHTNYIGLILIFSKYDEGKAAEKALRGEKL